MKPTCPSSAKNLKPWWPIRCADLPRVFEPFYTTKQLGEGAGLGLSMVRSFVERSGGHVAIESQVAVGTRVTCFIPQLKKQGRNAIAQRPVDIPRGRGERILLVEDELGVRKLVFKLLVQLGYHVTPARDGDHALKILEDIGPFDLLLSDVVLPGSLSGPQLANTVEKQRPQTRILLMSGYASDILDDPDGPGPTRELLHKPFRKAEIARSVRSAIDAGESPGNRVGKKVVPTSGSGRKARSWPSSRLRRPQNGTLPRTQKP